MACFFAMLLLSAAQGDNVYMGFQVQFVMVFSAAVGAVALAASAGKRAGKGGALGCLVVSWCAATVATFSMANGLCVWPVVTLLALAGRGLRSALATAALDAVEAAVYLHGYNRVPNPDHTGLIDAAADLWACTSYLLTYLGAVLAPTDPTLAGLGGCAAIALIVWWGWHHRRRFGGPDPWPRFAAGVLFFVLFSAAVTAVGRFRLGDEQALRLATSRPPQSCGPSWGSRSRSRSTPACAPAPAPRRRSAWPARPPSSVSATRNWAPRW